MFQRFSNVLILIFAVIYIGLFLSLDTVNYENWQAMHSAMWFKLFSTFTLVVVMINSILAGWQIGTDYTQKVPIAGFTPLFHGFYVLASAAFLAFGLYIIWFL